MALVLSTISAGADDKTVGHGSFEEFRKGLLQSYSSYREGVLKDYAKFLDGVWEEYATFKGEKRDSAPKPATAPVAPMPEASAATEELPAPEVVAVTAPEPVAAPKIEPKAVAPLSPTTYEFDFYGVPLSVADIDVKMLNRLEGSDQYANQWRKLADDKRSASLVKELQALAGKLNFNDYLTYDLVRHYVNARYGSAHSSTRSALIHYILANMGFDARLAATDSKEGLILLPFDTKVYGIPYMTVDNKKYYVFADEKLDTNARIFTCKLPADAPKGNALGLRLNPINIPLKEKPFDLTFGSLHLTGRVNANLFPIIYHYPQMEIADYVRSILDPDLRQSIVEQVKEQIGGQQPVDAVNNLLQFTQSAFAYATDEQAHGFEKPYFFEEILYYPECDCEDRVIFYSYLLWNALGVENQLITYPGHESAAVALPAEIDGDNYKYRGNTFYISDPTYIGAITGQCMPNFRNNKPEIEYYYKK